MPLKIKVNQLASVIESIKLFALSILEKKPIVSPVLVVTIQE
jgi:hypothetical protein